MRFNSRARKGRDARKKEEEALSFVSIHAPARGATATVSLLVRAEMFQFTRPQGARQCWLCEQLLRASFNSRARKGRDVPVHALDLTPSMFQFTRPQGARLRIE